MSDYDQTNRGALFKNHRKEKDTHPDYRGKVNVNGEEFEIAAWLRTSKKGDKYMSLSVSEPYQAEPKPQPARAPAPAQPDFNDDIPF